MNIDNQTIRDQFPALRNYTWFQNGGVSITPNVVADEHARLMQELLARGPMHIVYPDEEYPRRAETMRRLAEFFSVAPEELALMRGISEAFQTVLRGLSWRKGDEILITADEEAALLLPALHLRDRHGVKVVKLPLSDNVDQQQSAFEECLSDRTRLVAVSHVTTDLGYRLPVRELCNVARSRGVMTFVDIAHSAGLFPISLHELGCDFAGILSYKWMYAPYASGMLYVRRERLDELAVTYAGGRAEKWLDFENDQFELHDSAERFQFGPWSWPLVHSWAKSAAWLGQIGLDEIQERTAALTTRLKDGLQSIAGTTIYTPISANRSAALVTFGLEGWTGENLTTTLRERWNIIVKPLPHTREGLRISVPFFLLEEEVDQLVGAIETLAAERL